MKFTCLGLVLNQPLVYIIITCQCTSCSFGQKGSYFDGVGSYFYHGVKNLGCIFGECCSSRNGWLMYDYEALQKSLTSNVYGQHLVTSVVVKAIKSHLSNKSPSKALVLSFHGWTGSGKNYVAKYIARSLYKNGMNSKFVHLIVSTVTFQDDRLIDVYKLQVQDWIRGNVSDCAQSLFIFDEVDKMPMGVIDAIKPFIDYHESIFGIDFRKAIFIFLSNTGSRDINRTMLKLWRDGRERHSVTFDDMEPLIQNGAFNEQGGLHHSDLIQHNLVDFYIPFLPMERQHVELCIRDEIKKQELNPTNELVDKVIDSLIFFPPENKLYSSSGCKKVHAKVGYILMDSHFEKIFDEL